MVGRDLKQIYPARPRGRSLPSLLELRGVRYENGPALGASLSVRAGEIVGMAGLVGAGRTELAEAVFGIRRIVAGIVSLAGEPIASRSPSEAMRAGIALVPEDRRLHGLVVEESVSFNISLPNLDALSALRLVKQSAEQELTERMIARLNVRTPGSGQTVGLLSGGNQQKVVFGKWLARKPRLLILDEPTRGVDVGARGEIYSIIDGLANDGVAIWMISSDMEEVLGLSDRIIVMHEGRIAGELERSTFNEEAVMRLATGLENRS
jgi:ribose transport system ATP-binding protein